jgi:hypothetical protein
MPRVRLPRGGRDEAEEDLLPVHTAVRELSRPHRASLACSSALRRHREGTFGDLQRPATSTSDVGGRRPCRARAGTPSAERFAAKRATAVTATAVTAIAAYSTVLADWLMPRARQDLGNGAAVRDSDSCPAPTYCGCRARAGAAPGAAAGSEEPLACPRRGPRRVTDNDRLRALPPGARAVHPAAHAEARRASWCCAATGSFDEQPAGAGLRRKASRCWTHMGTPRRD